VSSVDVVVEHLLAVVVPDVALPATDGSTVRLARLGAGRTVVHAEVPAYELSRYPVDLRSVSHGTGTFTRSFVRYDYMPPALAREITA